MSIILTATAIFGAIILIALALAGIMTLILGMIKARGTINMKRGQ